MFDRILVICTGNICRSPIAEGLLKNALPGTRVTSAGTAAMVGAPAEPHSQAVCEEHGVDITAHRARQVTAAMLQDCDLVLALDGSHVAWLNRRHPQFHGKVHKLGKWRDDQDVPDPYMQAQSAFDECYLHIASLVQDWVKRL